MNASRSIFFAGAFVASALIVGVSTYLWLMESRDPLLQASKRLAEKEAERATVGESAAPVASGATSTPRRAESRATEDFPAAESPIAPEGTDTAAEATETTETADSGSTLDDLIARGGVWYWNGIKVDNRYYPGINPFVPTETSKGNWEEVNGVRIYLEPNIKYRYIQALPPREGRPLTPEESRRIEELRQAASQARGQERLAILDEIREIESVMPIFGGLADGIMYRPVSGPEPPDYKAIVIDFRTAQ